MMELELLREYFASGTNDVLMVNGVFCCHTIELPWKDNHRSVSCIPEGRYSLSKRVSFKRGWHLEVLGVPGRSLILIHPANNALLELQGCIAPVSVITGAGRGPDSRKALGLINMQVFAALELKEPFFLTILKK